MSIINKCKNIGELKIQSERRITEKLSELSDKNYNMLIEKIHFINNRLDEVEKKAIVEITTTPCIDINDIKITLEEFDKKINENNEYIQSIINGIIDEINILSNKIPDDNEYIKDDIINSARDYTNNKTTEILSILNRLEEKIEKLQNPTIKLSKIKK
jgi:hypothetical protein